MYRLLVAFAAAAAALACPGIADAGPATARTALAKLAWRSVGPYFGGRVVAVAGVPQNPDLFYMGAVDGGVWRSTDYGIRWVNLTDHTLPGASDSIGAIAVAPSNPEILYVGTGESDIRNDMVTGDGVFRSADGGKTWKAAGLADTHTISALVVDPKNPNLVYAASMGHVFASNPERGVFKSTDGGASWHKILYVNAKTGAIDLVMDPTNPQVLYAAMWQAYRAPWKLDDGGPASGLYKSVDGGTHWSEISRNPGFAHGILGRIGVSVAAADPSVVYAIVQARHGGVFRSSDGGASWQRVNADWELRQRGFYFMTIYTDPKDPNTVYVPQGNALEVSHDGGKSFIELYTPGPDNHVLWINPNDRKILLEGNDNGATVSTDGGETWSSLKNQPTGQYYHVALDDQFPFHMYGAQQDAGPFEGPSASPEGDIPLSAWHMVAWGESTFVAPQPGNPDVTYGSEYYSLMARYDMATGQYRDVSPWPDYRDGASSGELKYRFGWTHPIFFSPSDPKELLVGSQYVLKSSDSGRTWQRISPDLTRNDAATEGPTGGPIDLDTSGAEIFPDVSALAVSPLDGRVIWAGSADGLVHVTRDGGKHWVAVTPPALPEWAQISSIQPSHEAAGTAYLSASRYMWDDFHPYVFKTTDYGQRWTRITTGIPEDEYVFVVREDPSDPQLLFAGTKSTVFVSLNGGTRWQPLTLNLPHVQVRDIAINARQGDVVIATHGRAFWILDNLTLLEQLSLRSAVAADEVEVYAPQIAWLTQAYGVSLSNGDDKTVSTVGINPPFGATVFFRVPTGYDGKLPVSLSFLDGQGHLIRAFNLHLEHETRTPAPANDAAESKLTAITPGFNRFQWDLRFPDAIAVTGYRPPEWWGITDGPPDSEEGPTVIPGRYTVVLDYNGATSRRSFEVALDPRLYPAPGALEARLAFEFRIHGALDTLDRALNQAIALHNRLEVALAHHRVSDTQAGALALASLDEAIGKGVQLANHSTEADSMHEQKLHSRLAYLAGLVDMAYVKPTPAEYHVLHSLEQEATQDEERLKAAMVQGHALSSAALGQTHTPNTGAPLAGSE
ncbi:MAG: VPS10 domain-containing protein [Steroidobacteraceae bacterium]